MQQGHKKKKLSGQGMRDGVLNIAKRHAPPGKFFKLLRLRLLLVASQMPISLREMLTIVDESRVFHLSHNLHLLRLDGCHAR